MRKNEMITKEKKGVDVLTNSPNLIHKKDTENNEENLESFNEVPLSCLWRHAKSHHAKECGSNSRVYAYIFVQIIAIDKSYGIVGCSEFLPNGLQLSSLFKLGLSWK